VFLSCVLPHVRKAPPGEVLVQEGGFGLKIRFCIILSHQGRLRLPMSQGASRHARKISRNAFAPASPNQDRPDKCCWQTLVNTRSECSCNEAILVCSWTPAARMQDSTQDSYKHFATPHFRLPPGDQGCVWETVLSLQSLISKRCLVIKSC
jgi:hypothetical protein